MRDIAYFDGSDALRMHNYYTFLYNKLVFDVLKDRRGEGEAILFARSATVGGQQFPVHWGGDNTATYISMAETLRAGLSMSHSGFGYWSHDISGFESTAPAHVYKRWCQFGTCPPIAACMARAATGCRGCSTRRAATWCGPSPSSSAA